jgi:excisionase family DNA binding protein
MMLSDKQKKYRVVQIESYISSQRNPPSECPVGVARRLLIVEEAKGGQMFYQSIVISKKHQHGEGDSTMTEDTREELLTVREVARRLRVDDTTVRRWIKSGALEAITLPHRGKRQAYRIKKTTLDKLLNSSIPL